VPAGVVRKRGEELLALLREARSSGLAPIEPPRRPTDQEQALAAALLQVVRDQAAALEIGPEVLATRRDVESIAFGSVPIEDSPLLRGWRAEVLGERFRTLTRAARDLSR
jgi:ribonuclease D